MPSIDFELPHWLYWASLALFPLIAMVMARRVRSRGYSLPLAYLILVTGGMLGLHRFYLKNLWGLLYLPLFLGILYANAEQREARVAQSTFANQVQVARTMETRARATVEGGDARLAELRARVTELEPGGVRARVAERAVQREELAIEQARERLVETEAQLAAAEPALAEATASRAFWNDTAGWLLYAILAFMAVDAVLLPWMKRRAGEKAALEPHVEVEEAAPEAAEDESRIGTGWTGALDRLSYYTGEFVAYWSVIAVFVYYYEVIARYVFNSPTNWAHEGMYLMFGMQYLICGAFAMLTDSHVKVDIFYANWSAKRKAWVDLFTSIFFFIFAGTILVTGWIFAWDAMKVREISFSEWAIHYWPFKWAIVLGGLLLVLQGISKLAQDLRAIRGAHVRA